MPKPEDLARLNRHVLLSKLASFGVLRRSALFALSLCMLLCVGCFSSRAVGPTSSSQGEGRTLGSFTVTSDRLGHLTVMPSSCTAGERQLFLGADLEDGRTGIVVRLVVDPLDGPAARVFASESPFEKTAVFRRSDCRVFHFSLDTTGWRINRIRDYRLTLDLDCSNQDGDVVIGQASATHCH